MNGHGETNIAYVAKEKRELFGLSQITTSQEIPARLFELYAKLAILSLTNNPTMCQSHHQFYQPISTLPQSYSIISNPTPILITQ